MCGPYFLPQIMRINMNQLNALHGYKPTEKSIEWNIQPPEVHFKSLKNPPQTSPVVSTIVGRLNHNAVDNDDV